MRALGIASLVLRTTGLVALGAGLALPASAHNQTYPVAGDAILVRTDQGPGTEVFQFTAVGPEVPYLDHDPREDATALLVRGLGAAADRTELVSLDRNLWSATAAGFEYTDPAGTRGGITHAILEPGHLEIQAGAGFGWKPVGAQDEVWVHLRIGDTGLCSSFASSNASTNGTGHFAAAGAAAPGVCPAQVCGDGIPQVPEACDDGNLDTGDGCEETCAIGPCNAQSFPSTFEAIQTVVFEGGYGCNDGTCHDSAFPKNDLELTHDVAYEQLLGLDGHGRFSSDYPFLKLVEPGEPDGSYLYIKLAAKTFPNHLPFVVDPGTAMPSGGLVALSEDHLEAVSKWIRFGAPREGVVSGTQEQLGTCLPEPTPLKIPVPDPPLPGAGVQLEQTPWDLPATTPTENGEDEICMATYYDLSDLVPEWAQVDCPSYLQPVMGCSNDLTVCTSDTDCSDGATCTAYIRNANGDPSARCFVYDRSTLLQDPQSHHSIIQLYTGRFGTDDADWGEWTYKFEPDDPRSLQNGMPCEPKEIISGLGYHPGCSSTVVSSVACGGFGPEDANQFSPTGGGGGNLMQFSGSQEPYFDQTFADGVYATLPLAGVVVWNSHAFNLTAAPSTMAQYLNLEFAPEENQVYPVQGIFQSRWIFAQNVPPFGTQEICGTYTIPQHAHLFELGSHTHLRGVQWRTWGPPNTPCQPGCPAPYTPNGFFTPCLEDDDLPYCEGPRDDTPPYFSTDYTDPLQLRFDPPRVYDSPDVEDRTFLFCSLYDNGATEDSPPVKRRSTTPYPPGIAGIPLATPEILNLFGVGGPCPVNRTVCSGGPNQGMPCVAAPNGTLDDADHALCGDPAEQLCDACPARGGVTTQDEMFILTGSYFVTSAPEPGAAALGAAGIAALAALSRRRTRRR